MRFYRTYSDPAMADNKWSLPDVAVFYSDEMGEDGEKLSGWFYQYGLPGCMPDSDPFGPYESAFVAESAMRDSLD